MGKAKRRAGPAHWSFSSLSEFEQCPKRWYYNKIAKLPQPPNKYFERGNRVHSMLENALVGKKAPRASDLPNGWVSDTMKRYRKMKALRAEQRVCLDHNWNHIKPVPGRFMPPGTWVIAIIDVLAAGFFADWKTGKIYGDKHEDQTHLYATALSSATGVKHWKADLVYLDQEHVEEMEFDFRDDGALEDAQNHWTKRATKLENATRYPKVPQRLCKWCPFQKGNGGPCDGQG